MKNYFSLSMRPQDIGQISALGLAHCGDAVFELLVRSWLCDSGKLTTKQLHRATVSYVCAPAQAARVDRMLPLLTQAELAKRAGLGLKTITNYEKGTTYPQDRRVYGVLAEILGTSADYLHNENDDFVSMAGKEFGYRGRIGAEKLVGELTGLFAGGEMAEEDMDELMLAAFG